MRSYFKAVKTADGTVWPAKFAKDFGISGDIVRVQRHGAVFSAVLAYNQLIQVPYLFAFNSMPIGLKWDDPNNGVTMYDNTGGGYNGPVVTQMFQSTGPQFAAGFLDIEPYDTHPLN
jgi:hypothetical protein